MATAIAPPKFATLGRVAILDLPQIDPMRITRNNRRNLKWQSNYSQILRQGDCPDFA
jgi:hypothetical protein